MQVSHRQHFFHAALFWSLTGFLLGFFGVKWVWHGFAAPAAYGWLVFCFFIGLLKGEVAIGKAGKKAVVRIKNLPEKSSFHQVFTKGQWMIVFGMMFLGMLIRFSGIDKSYRGLVLATIGVALLWASRFFWRETCHL